MKISLVGIFGQAKVIEDIEGNDKGKWNEVTLELERFFPHQN